MISDALLSGNEHLHAYRGPTRTIFGLPRQCLHSNLQEFFWKLRATAPGEGPATNLTKLPFDLAVRIYA